MKRITLSFGAGLSLVLMSALNILGDSLSFYSVGSFIPFDFTMSFNSALCFLFAGSALLVSNQYPLLQKKSDISAGTAIILLILLTINPFLYFGKMAENSAIAFLFSGITFLLLPMTHKKPAAIIAQTLIFCVFILGFSALLGFVLELKSVYSWYQYTDMSLNSALCTAILGLGLWSAWSKKIDYSWIHTGKQEKRIIWLSATVIFCVLFLSGLLIARMLQTEIALSDRLIDEEIEPTLLIATIVGMGLLLWQLLPLVREILYSEKKLFETNTRLRESENRFRSAFDFAAIGMALISQQGRFLRVNSSLCQILGYSERELLTMDSRYILHPDDLKATRKFVRDLMEGKIKSYQFVQRYFHKKGEIIWGLLSMSMISDQFGNPLYFIAQLQNITAEKTAEERLRHLAYHDALTGLYNRNRLEQQIQELLVSAQRHKEGFALIFIDLDRFKNINDTLGHDAGDVLLQIVAQRLKNTVRSTDAIARIGGDEFIIILPDINKVDKIATIVRKILDSLLQPIMIKGHEIYATMSIGVSVYPYDGEDIATLMKNADLALYRAKELGRNNYQFCTPEMTAKAQEKMARQNAIVHALAKHEFELYYQPKMDLKTRTISGVEALLRWHNKEYENVNAEEIIHLAEETGVIIALNDWVLKTACNQMSAWHKAGFSSLTLAVNLSSRQFKQINFAENLLSVLSKSNFPTESLELEITESLLMQDPEYIFNILSMLKEKNIKIVIDDFGTGYSSLDYLRRFSIDKIKIDKKFVQKILKDSANDSIVTAIIAMANKLGIKTVAEGVETSEQYQFLVREKCREIQGFYLMKPANVEVITQFLSNPLQSPVFRE